MKTPSKETMEKSIKYVASQMADKFLEWDDDRDRFNAILFEYKEETRKVACTYADLCDTAEEREQVWAWRNEIVAEIGFAELINRFAEIWLG